MFERLGLAEHAEEGKAHKIPDEAWDTVDDDGIKHMEIEIQLWGSLRGQTLARVIHGVMQFEQGIIRLEWGIIRLERGIIRWSGV